MISTKTIPSTKITWLPVAVDITTFITWMGLCSFALNIFDTFLDASYVKNKSNYAIQ